MSQSQNITSEQDSRDSNKLSHNQQCPDAPITRLIYCLDWFSEQQHVQEMKHLSDQRRDLRHHYLVHVSCNEITTASRTFSTNVSIIWDTPSVVPSFKKTRALTTWAQNKEHVEYRAQVEPSEDLAGKVVWIVLRFWNNGFFSGLNSGRFPLVFPFFIRFPIRELTTNMANTNTNNYVTLALYLSHLPFLFQENLQRLHNNLCWLQNLLLSWWKSPNNISCCCHLKCCCLTQLQNVSSLKSS